MGVLEITHDFLSRHLVKFGIVWLVLCSILGAGCTDPISTPPLADFTANPLSGPAPLLVQFSNRSDDGGEESTEWSWDFGDGNTSLDFEPAHTYSIPGFYSVTLTAQNSVDQHRYERPEYIEVIEGGNSGSLSASFSTIGGRSGGAPLVVQFGDESTSGSKEIISWEWTFGDGSVSSEQNPTHTFNRPGRHDVTLTVSDGNEVASMTLYEYVAAIGDTFLTDEQEGEVIAMNRKGNLTYQFIGQVVSETPIATWHWDFGDGTTSNESSPRHQFSEAVNFDVRLVVTTDDGEVESTRTVPTSSRVWRPFVSHDFSDGLEVRFEGESGLDDLSRPRLGYYPETFPDTTTWLWDFGDGSTSNEQSPTHQFAECGTYNVQLTIRNPYEAVTESAEIVLSPEPRVVLTSSITSPPAVSFSVGVESFPGCADGQVFEFGSWNFGDGEGYAGTESTVRHIYSEPGTYTVQFQAQIANAGVYPITLGVTVPAPTDTPPSRDLAEFHMRWPRYIHGEPVDATYFRDHTYLATLVGEIVRSPNGTSWTRVQNNQPDSSVTALAASSDQIVVVGSKNVDFSGGPLILTSSDGKEWIDVTPEFPKIRYRTVAYGNGRFVALGSIRVSSVEVPAGMTSTNGVDWVQIAQPLPGVPTSIWFLKDRFIASLIRRPTPSSFEGVLVSSTDGESWEEVLSLPNNAVEGMAYGNGFFAAIGAPGQWKSDDGVLWASVSTENYFYGLAYGNGVFVAQGSGDFVAITTDLVEIGPPVTVPFSENNNSRSPFVFVKDRFFSLSKYRNPDAYAPQVYSSFGGRIWENVIDSLPIVGDDGSLGEPAGRLTYENGRYFVGGPGLLSSDDGISWDPHDLPGDSDVSLVRYLNGLYIAVGNPSLILTSSDAAVWERISFGSSYFSDVAFANGRYVAVGGEILYSDDARTWLRANSLGLTGFSTVVYRDNLFIAVGPGILTSEDGIEWSVAVSDLSVENILETPTSIYAYGVSGIYSSQDGINWELELDRRTRALAEKSDTLVALTTRSSSPEEGVAVSIAGSDWLEYEVDASTAGITASDEHFFLLLDDYRPGDNFLGSRIDYSADGIGWQVHAAVPEANVYQTNDFLFNNNQLIYSGGSGRLQAKIIASTGNGKPTIAGPSTFGTDVEVPLRIEVPVEDPEFDSLDVEVLTGPVDLVLETAGLTMLNWTPTQKGTFDVSLGVSDGLHDLVVDLKIVVKDPEEELFDAFTTEDHDGDGTPDFADELPFDGSRSSYPSESETEPNDTLSEVGTVTEDIGPPIEFSGIIGTPGDIDHFGISTNGGVVISAEFVVADGGLVPDLMVVDILGNVVERLQPLTTADLPVAVFSYFLPGGGSYFLRVSDEHGQGGPEFRYVIHVFKDADRDGLDDDRETALGLDPTRGDSDSDGVGDWFEFPHDRPVDGSGLDVDMDGKPNWLDDDSDGDGILDFLEGSGDVDGDGLANFLDTDSDGNGIGDAEEASAEPGEVLDSDSDSIENYLDLDDDGDGLLDTNDSERLVPIPIADINDLYIEAVGVENAIDGTIGARGVVLHGHNLKILGVEFSPTPSDHFVVLRGPEITMNLVPSSATIDSLQLTTPEGELDEVFVVKNGVRSNALSLDVIEPGSPILFELLPRDVIPGSELALDGLNLGDVTAVQFGETEVPPLSTAPDRVTVTVPTPLSAEFLFLLSTEGPSNAIDIEPVVGVPGQLTLPVGAVVDPLTVSIISGTFQIVTPAMDASIAYIAVNQSEMTFVHALLPEVAPEPSSIFMQAMTVPGDSFVDIDAASTAVAMVAQSLFLNQAIATESAGAARALLGALPEVVALASVVNDEIVADPRFLEAPSPTFVAALITASAAAEQAVIDALDAGEILPRDAEPLLLSLLKVITTKQSAGPPTILRIGAPLEVDIELLHDARKNVLKVENDTQLYLSLRAVEPIEGGVVIQEYVDNPFGSDMISAQSRISFSTGFLNAGVKEFPKLTGVNADIRIVTGGFNGGLTLVGIDKAAADQAITRTLLQGFWKILISGFLLTDNDFPCIGGLLLKLAPNAFASATALLAEGDVDAAGQIMKDAIISRSDEILRKVRKLLLGNSISLTSRAAEKTLFTNLRIIDLAATTGLLLRDSLRVPPKQDFEVDWPLKLNTVEPNLMVRRNADFLVTITGEGFRRITSTKPYVGFSDMGRGARENDFEPIVSPDGTTLTARMSALFRRTAEGPIRVSVSDDDAGLVEAPDYELIRVQNQLQLFTISPLDAGPGQRIVIEGFGLEVEAPGRYEVVFQSTINALEIHTSRIGDLVTSTTGTTSEVPRIEIHTSVPNTASSGPYEVYVREALSQFGVSNSVSYVVAPPTIEGAVLELTAQLGGVFPWILPARVTLSGLLPAQVDFGGVNGDSQTGSPLFTSQVAPGSVFFPVTRVTGFPEFRDDTLSPNFLGHSSFIAIAPDGRTWINASIGAKRFSSGSTIEREYQIRYYSGDSSTPDSMEIGIVGSSGSFGTVSAVTVFDAFVVD